VVLVGSNLRHELPLVNQRVLKANKRGAKVFVINPVDFDNVFNIAGKAIVKPSALPAVFAAAAQAAGVSLPSGVNASSNDAANAIATALKAAEGNAVIFLGEIAENHANASHIRTISRAIADAGLAKINRISQGANALGLNGQGVLPSSSGLNAQSMLQSARKAYVLYGVDPQFDFADNTQALKAFANAQVIAFSAYASEALKKLAHVILPIAALPEMEASLTNLDGITQHTQAGSKLIGEARPGWRVLRALGAALGVSSFDFVDLQALRASMQSSLRQSGNGLSAATSAKGIERVTSTPVYRADAVLRRAAALNSHPLTRGACAVLHPEDAIAQGISEGSMLRVGDGMGNASLPAKISAAVAKGAVWIERDYEATAPMSVTAELSVVKA
jgi:NADH-quinone oxidoreductase subunit G